MLTINFSLNSTNKYSLILSYGGSYHWYSVDSVPLSCRIKTTSREVLKKVRVK